MFVQLGPPGCGKTLAFMLASDNLGGIGLEHSPSFQHLRKAKKIMYGCSASSTSAELSARFKDAHLQQADLEKRQFGRHMCVVGIDEAGLTPENRMVLKALHDYLDMRVIGTVMMSNTTLDAAKTSRTIQLLQTQANETDLFELASGLLLEPNSEISYPMFVPGWQTQIRGLCEAYSIVLNEKLIKDNWFHSRDFVYLCRMLRTKIQASGQILPTLFDGTILLKCLRRHFQPLDPNDFPYVANHFLDCCNLDVPAKVDALDAQVVNYLRDSLKDKLDDAADPTSAHCRYTMIVDPTDSEVFHLFLCVVYSYYFAFA